MTSRELVIEALNHRQGERVPLDLGGCGQTGMQVSTVYRLRQALKLDPPGTPVKVTCVTQMLGEIKPDLLAAAATSSIRSTTSSTGCRSRIFWRCTKQ